MAYGLRYTIPQILRDSKSLVVYIYEDSYVGSSYEYNATSIKIQPNSNTEDPIACVISTQLDISFIISTDSDYSNLPDLLNYNDTKYYVELKIDNVIKWRGYLFNDYVDVSFTTGIQTINLNCIDGLSFLRYNFYNPTENINGLEKLLDIINNALYLLPSYTTVSMFMCCSYFATGMVNRTDASLNEPFNQSFQYRRDFIGLDYYTILQNIMLSFGCRLFQSEGSWYILPMNQMASTIYYTQYDIYAGTPSLITSGVLNKLVNIQEYTTTSVHFIDNNQTKIVRKGFPKIQSIVPFTTAKNYIHNGSFKQNPSLNQATGWVNAKSGTGVITLTVSSNTQFNSFTIYGGISGSASITTDSNYLANMYGPAATLSFDLATVNITDTILIYINITIGSTLYYLNNSLVWTTTSSAITKSSTVWNQSEKISINIPLGTLSSPHPSLTFEGAITVKFLSNTANQGGNIRNIILSQNAYDIQEATITRYIGDIDQTAKSIDLYYGLNYPFIGTYDVKNNVGMITDYYGVQRSDWYVQGTPSTTFDSLPFLIMKQYSNLLNKNIATLEGDLGNYDSSVGMIGLDKVYTITDTSTNSLTYNGKKFLANRLTSTPYINQTDSMQFIEISDQDIVSIETIVYITDQEQETPVRYFNN